jgi:hypothetical protein
MSPGWSVRVDVAEWQPTRRSSAFARRRSSSRANLAAEREQRGGDGRPAPPAGNRRMLAVLTEGR